MNSKNANPYWHLTTKPHVFDPVKVEELCVTVFETFSTSLAMASYYVDDAVDTDEEGGFEFPKLVSKHQEKAEAKISSSLLILSITYRALEEQLEDSEKFQQFKVDNATIFDEKLIYFVGDGRKTLREACNKVIHAVDFRPVYDNGSMPRDEGVWGMDGQIEMEGMQSGKPWHVVISVLDFLEAMLDISDFVTMLREVHEPL
jgi:hypothetical protein